MKTVVKVLLGLSVVLLAYFCVTSITTPIKFEEKRADREKVVIARLVDIRKAQIEFKNQKGRYTASFDTLISFIKNGKMKMVKKEGALTDEQMEKGLTEKKAMEIINKGNAKEIAENGLQNFRRDTTYISVLTSLFDGVYDTETINQLSIIPFSENKKFEMATTLYKTASGIPIPLFEAKAPYEAYLGDLDRQELINLIDIQKKLDRFAGLQVGSTQEPNNNAGNWE